MVLDVHKWLPMPAIAARARQSCSAAPSSAGARCSPGVVPRERQPMLSRRSMLVSALPESMDACVLPRWHGTTKARFMRC